VDASGNTNTLQAPNGAITAGSSLLASDTVDGSCDFPGATVYLRTVTASPPSLTSLKPVTIEAWIKADSVAGSRTIVRKADYEFAFRVVDGKLDYFYNDAGVVKEVTTTSAPIAVGSTYHVVVTDDGSLVSFYVNGTLTVGQATLTGITVLGRCTGSTTQAATVVRRSHRRGCDLRYRAQRGHDQATTSPGWRQARPDAVPHRRARFCRRLGRRRRRRSTRQD
jgi:hypothetical protein